jgi:hypothetical protein
MLLSLKILGGLIALALGVWLGLPGRYQQSVEDIEELMDRPGGRTRKVKRHFTPMAWFHRKAPPPVRKTSPRFKLVAPDEER